MADEICEMIAGGTALITICSLPEMPPERTVYEWLAKNDTFSQKYARARERQADLYAAEIVLIADSAPNTIRGVEQARLRIDARKWAASKLAPKRYSDRVQTDHTSSDGSMTPRSPVQIVIEGE